MDSQRANTRHFFILACIIALFLILSALMLWRYYFVAPDSAYLLALGRNFVTGKGLTINGAPHFRYPPAYGVASGLLYLATGNIEASAHIVSLLSGLGAIILVYFYTSNAYNRETGLLAAALVALNPLFGRISSAALAESFYAFGYAAYILVLFRLLKKPNWWLSFIAGLIAAVVYLTRAEGFLILPLGFIMLLVAWWKGRHGAGKIALSLALLLIGWLVLAFPYLVFLRENLGGWALSGKITQNIERVSEVFYSGDYETYEASTLREHESPGLVPYLVQNFPRVARRYAYFTWEAVKLAIIRSWPLVLLFIWFSVLALKERTARGWHFVAMASPLLVYPLAHIEIRYLTPYFIAFAPVIARGMNLAMKPGRFSRLQRPLVILTFALMLVGCVYDIYRTAPPPVEHKILADWMAANLPDARSERISSRFAYVSFYLGNEDFRYLPHADALEDCVRLARERHITYLVIDRRLTPSACPELEPLLDPSNAPDDLQFVIKLDPPAVPSTIVLYRVRGN